MTTMTPPPGTVTGGVDTYSDIVAQRPRRSLCPGRFGVLTSSALALSCRIRLYQPAVFELDKPVLAKREECCFDTARKAGREVAIKILWLHERGAEKLVSRESDRRLQDAAVVKEHQGLHAVRLWALPLHAQHT